MSNKIFGIVIKQTTSYNPDQGNPMSRDIERTSFKTTLYDNEQDFAEAIHGFKGKNIKCFRGEYIETPKVSVKLI